MVSSISILTRALAWLQCCGPGDVAASSRIGASPPGKAGAACRAAGLAIAIVAASSLAGCDSVAEHHALADACKSVGLCDEPQPSPVALKVLCDPSPHSSCTESALPRVLKPVLHHAAERPGSRVELWILGKTFATTLMVGEQVSPALRGGERQRRIQQDRFVAAANDHLMAAAAYAFQGQPARRSPIAEGITKVASADAGGLLQTIIVATDLREVSDVADLESCGRRIPSEKQFVALLRRTRALDPALLAGTYVEIVFAEPATSAPQCPGGLDRESRIRGIWTAALQAAGAADVRISSGPPALSGAGATEPDEPKKEKKK